MSKGLYDAVSSMAASEKRLDVIAQNIANASAIGYKREVGTVNSVKESCGNKSSINWLA